MRNKIVGLLAGLEILLLCSGCATEKPKLESPLTTPVFNSPAVPTSIARPACLTLIQAKGNTVCGYIISPSGSPIVNRPIFLAQGKFASDNSVVFAALDQATAPKGTTDKNGMFYIVGVPSDLYFLMIDAYPQPIILREPAHPTNDLIVDWRKTGGAVDLGVISFQP